MTPRRAILLVGALLAVTIVAGASVLLGKPNRSPGPSPAPGASVPGPGLGAIQLTMSADVDTTYDPTITRAPTAGANQPRLWQAAGTWWGVLVAGVSGELHIARRDPATGRFVDTGTLVDERPRVRAAVAWDGTRLAVLTAGDRPTPANAARVTTFHLDPAANRFVIDPDMPVAVTANGVTSATIARDGSGVLWVAAISDGRLVVRHSTANDHLWSADRAPAIATTPTGIRTASLVASGGRTVLAWNAATDSTLQVALHVDGAADDQWTASSTRIEGLSDAPGELAVATAAGTPDPRILVAFQASATVAGGSLAPGAIVVSRAPDGAWTSAQLGRTKDHLRTPIPLVDDAHGALVVVAGTTNGQIVVKSSPLDRLAFEAGTGIPLIGTGDQPVAADPTTAAGPVDLTAGVVVLAADDAAGQYRHGVVTMTPAGSSAATPSPSTPDVSPSPSPSTPGPVRPTVLRVDAFDAWPVNTQPPDWDLTAESGGRGSAVIVPLRSATNRSLRVATSSAAGSVRACTAVPRISTNSTTMTALVRLGRLAGSDATIASVRGPGGEAASLRVTRHGFVAYYAGAVKRTTTTLIRAGAWYRIRITVDVARHTWTWSIATSSGRKLASASGIAWRQANVPAVDTFCLQPGEGRGSTVFVDDLVVAR